VIKLGLRQPRKKEKKKENFAAPCEILETQELFFKADVTRTTAYACLPLFIDSWNIKEKLDSELFWAGDSRFCHSSRGLDVIAPDFKSHISYVRKRSNFRLQ